MCVACKCYTQLVFPAYAMKFCEKNSNPQNIIKGWSMRKSPSSLQHA
jgi:hypothetical protein